MQGRCVPYRSSWQPGEGPQPGDYWKDTNGHWGGVTPNGHFCNLAGHRVTENPNGTITVSPSIAVSQGDEQLYHGYLENGVWRDA